MRGEQMAAQRDEWSAVLDVDRRGLDGVDAVVIVKAISDASLRAVKAWGGLVLYDPLDFWVPGNDRVERDPGQDVHSRADAEALFRPVVDRIRPDLVLCPTTAMAEDLSTCCKTMTLHHHFDPRLEAAPPSSGRKRVAYHGRTAHVHGWRFAVNAACLLNGAKYIKSSAPLPPAADVMLAVRGGSHANWLSRRWKSNVKAATAQRLGLPFVCQCDNGYLETHPGAFYFHDFRSLRMAIRDALASERPAPEEWTYSVEWAAERLAAILEAH